MVEAVHLRRSIFHGAMLGLFVVAFFVAWISATPMLIAALLAEGLVTAPFLTSQFRFLWYDVIGSAAVVAVAILLEAVRRRLPPGAATDLKAR